MSAHSSNVAWRIPQAEKPGGLQSMRPQRVRHNCTRTRTHRHTHIHTHTHTHTEEMRSVAISLLEDTQLSQGHTFKEYFF